ncbi:MAG TPA: BTAD domain-containing putative transcriptional regulator [Solirubrobacterales bacterium]|nr:BTAD domain-containing putative transcriptional regulator [Solirubrobacterales bacterium]
MAGLKIHSAHAAESPQLFERFPYGLALIDRDGRIVRLNHQARRILFAGDSSTDERWSCCELICDRLGTILNSGCISALAFASRRELPEIRIDLDGGRLQTAAWVTASVLDDERTQVLLHLRPGRPGDRRRRTRQGWHGDSVGGRQAELRIETLGRVQVEGPSGPVNGEWLAQRPGEVFKYLVCERRRAVASDQIAEALWPEAGPEEGRNRLRFHIHSLREKIEPQREPRSGSGTILSRRGGYFFDTSMVWIDADEFEREARAGLAAVDRGKPGGAAPHLRRANLLYRDEFMSEDPYAEWAQEERERLRDLAVNVLRAQIDLELAAGRLEAAASPARRLADIEPFDADAQRLFIEIALRRGRRGEAVRRYELHRDRMKRSFGIGPEFDLKEVECELALEPSPREAYSTT